MRLLLDTHVVLWWMTADRRLPAAIRDLIASEENDVAVSAATFWEIAIKNALGRIEIDLEELMAAVAADGFQELPVRAVHTLVLPALPLHHRDPFDRLLIAQAISEQRRLATRDVSIMAYSGVRQLDLIPV